MGAEAYQKAESAPGDAKVAVPAAPSGSKSQRKREREPDSRKPAGGGGGGGSDWRAPSDHYSPQEKATEVGPREREREREPDQRERERERNPEQVVKDSKAADGPQGGDTRETEQGSHEQGSHSTHNCSTRDNAFNARVNMLISSSHADAQAHVRKTHRATHGAFANVPNPTANVLQGDGKKQQSRRRRRRR